MRRLSRLRENGCPKTPVFPQWPPLSRDANASCAKCAASPETRIRSRQKLRDRAATSRKVRGRSTRLGSLDSMSDAGEVLMGRQGYPNCVDSVDTIEKAVLS